MQLLFTFCIHWLIALSAFFFSSSELLLAFLQSSNLSLAYTFPSSSNLSIFPIRIGRTIFLPFKRSKALSTARLVCEVIKILALGSRNKVCQIISAITVVLPVPGGPCIKAISLAKIALATASSCLG